MFRIPLTPGRRKARLHKHMPISRTHRPQKFKDVTGQQHVTETLRSEVDSGILGHAYLFSGPRGIGKTTTARIFAKALLNEQTDNGEPPVDSEVSKDIDNGTCIDLIEIDAASHTGVENIREAIIEHVRFAPARWKRKVYIIDECHMLSASAWNAMLKTLEEPPPYAYFVLATTELHKVPETIKSRCQRFEFRRIEPHALTERLRALSDLEKIAIDEDAIRMIVHASDGCVRDAESLLEQLSSLGAERITTDIASLILPTSRIPEVVALLRHCSERNVPQSMQATNELLNSGIPAVHIITDILSIVRTLLTAVRPEDKERLASGDDAERAISSLTDAFEIQELMDIALMVIERRKDVKTGTDPVFILELIVLAIAGSLLPHASSRTRAVPSDLQSYVQPQTQTAESKKETTKTNERNHAEPQTETDCEEERNKLDIHEIRKYWNVIIREVENANHSIPFVLKTCSPKSVQGNTVHIEFKYAFHREKIIDDIKTKRIVERAMRTVLKHETLIIEGFVADGIATAEQPNNPSADVVSKILDTFGGQIVE